MNKKERGQSILELLIAVGLMVIFIPALLTGLVSSREGKSQQKQRIEALALMREAEEALRSVRESGWSTIAQNGTFHIASSSGQWVLVSGGETIGSFTRQIVFSDVARDASGQIVQSGGSIDPSTRKATITVSWSSPIASSVEIVSYLVRYLNNTTYIETTQAQFNTGTKTSVTVTNTNGGEVVLGAGGGGSWCNPNLSITALDLPKNGVANAVTAIEGFAFAGTGENASGESYVKVNISNSDPPVASISGVFNGYKTNDVFGEANYGYIATDTNSKEIVILNIASTPYSEIGSFDAPGQTDASSVFVLGNTGYMTQGNILRNFDLTSKSGPHLPIDADGVALAGVGTSVVVVGNYAYVSLSGSLTEMQIIDLSDPLNLTIAGYADVNGGSSNDVFVNPLATRAYLITNASLTQRELFIIDISTKTGSRPTISSYEANGMNPKAVVVVPGNNLIIVGEVGEEYQVVDIANENIPQRCGGLQINTGVNDIASVLESDGDAYSYIVTGDSTTELKIIEGGPGGQFGTSGTFESATYDAASEVAFNSFIVNGNVSGQTTLQYQLASADENPLTGDCTGVSFNFLGPDGTINTKFATSSAIPVNDDGSGYENPGRCLRYKVFLDTQDYLSSPVFNDITVNYSP